MWRSSGACLVCITLPWPFSFPHLRRLYVYPIFISAVLLSTFRERDVDLSLCPEYVGTRTM